MLKSNIPKARRSFMGWCICAVILVMSYLGHWLASVTGAIGRGWGGRMYASRCAGWPPLGPDHGWKPWGRARFGGLDNYYSGNVPMNWGAVGKI